MFRLMEMGELVPTVSQNIKYNSYLQVLFSDGRPGSSGRGNDQSH